MAGLDDLAFIDQYLGKATGKPRGNIDLGGFNSAISRCQARMLGFRLQRPPGYPCQQGKRCHDKDHLQQAPGNAVAHADSPHSWNSLDDTRYPPEVP
ncbi:hypothetical protein [Halomonas sp. PBN3]|uniref:hypothetical protein n=1 Tax=Halomonas sp. PBN3 TaxID=1397528 RepID=UPI001F205857